MPQEFNMLYVTLEPETALCETDVKGRDYATIATYKVQNSIRVLDLTKIEKLVMPSIFDEKNREKREAISFLKMFGESISVQNNGNEIEYVPTQIVTEYFRFVRNRKQKGYEGILYHSAKNPGGKCLCLFMTRDEVLKGKHGIHIVANKTKYYEKVFKELNTDSTKAARKTLVDSCKMKENDHLD